MARPIWKGHISFGLVSVPVTLVSGEERTDISFHLVDSRNSARIRYERVNEETGEEVPWDKIVKGYQLKNDNYVLLSEDEFERASVEMTRTIEIEQFIDVADLDIRYFDRPYLLLPDKQGEKGYVLLREAIQKTGKAGIAKIVIRARQHLAAVVALENALVLELLRFDQEVRSLSDYKFPGSQLKKYKITSQEIALASQLIEGMSSDWDPTGFHDEYRAALMKLINKKVKQGKTEAIEYDDEDEKEEEPKTINFMEMLKQSVQKSGKSRVKLAATPQRKSRTGAKRKTKRKRAS
jgi:DNA end-binding protein Ku